MPFTIYLDEIRLGYTEHGVYQLITEEPPDPRIPEPGMKIEMKPGEAILGFGLVSVKTKHPNGYKRNKKLFHVSKIPKNQVAIPALPDREPLLPGSPAKMISKAAGWHR